MDGTRSGSLSRILIKVPTQAECLFLCFHQDVPLTAFCRCFLLSSGATAVEIWSTILRSLDSLSLLATGADPVCLDVCRGDALLKKMLRKEYGWKESCLRRHDASTACCQYLEG
ncbi:hypothetical protein JTB14_013049 [Gonioctena quinquepunctata]|nr:hypothetical protein JTB14_013049 [Gonioctena quinquepunctata]